MKAKVLISNLQWLFPIFFLHKKCQNAKKRFLIQERSLLSVLTVFIPLLHCSTQKKGFLTAQTQNLLKRIKVPNLVVILDTPIDICVSRIITRDRFQEKKYLRSYIENVSSKHKELCMFARKLGVPVLHINTMDSNYDQIDLTSILKMSKDCTLNNCSICDLPEVQ